MKDFDVVGPKGLFLLCILLRILKLGISSSVKLVLTTTDLEVVTKEILDLANLSGAQTLCVYELAEVVVVGEYKYLVLRLF